MILIKVRTADVGLIVRSLYGSDYDFLSSVPGDTSLRLDVLVKELVLNAKNSYFFKVQHLNGALIGFFMVPMVNPDRITQYFYIKPSARITEYYQAFYKLVSETVNGEIKQSIGAINVPDIEVLLKDNTTILGPYRPFGNNIKST